TTSPRRTSSPILQNLIFGTHTLFIEQSILWRRAEGKRWPDRRAAEVRTAHRRIDRRHRNAAHLLRRRAQSHECIPLEAQGGPRRRSCRSLRAPCGLCLGEPLRSPSRSRPPQCPYIGNKSSQPVCCNSRNITPMSSAPKPVTNLQQPPFSFSFFHLPFASDPKAPQKIACNIIHNAAGPCLPGARSRESGHHRAAASWHGSGPPRRHARRVVSAAPGCSDFLRGNRDFLR